MDVSKQRKFNERMGRRQQLFHGGKVKRQYFDAGGSASSGAALGAAAGSVIPGIGTAIGGIIGGIGGLLAGLTSGTGPKMPNITDPVTGQQITDANGNVVASQAQLQSFAMNMQGVNGVQNQQAVLSQLQGVANGTGPNPAQAMLAQSTGQNVAAQAAQAAGQRGADANVGLLQRNAAMTGSNIQQQAAGQGATLQANQSLNALNSMGQIAGQQVGETQGALNSANTAATTNQGQLLGAQGGYNSAITAGQGNVNSTNQTQNSTIAGVANPLIQGGIAGLGTTLTNSAVTPKPAAGNANQASGPPMMAKGGKVCEGPHKSHVANFLMSGGGKVPAMVSPGEIYLNPEKVKRVLDGENPLKIGERFQGKGVVKGDSRKNDTIPTTLEEGGVVIPRSHVKDPEKAELFTHRAVHMKRRSQS